MWQQNSRIFQDFQDPYEPCNYTTKNIICTLHNRVYVHEHVILSKKNTSQRAKKVVSNSLGLVDFAIGLVNSILNLPDGLVKCFEEFKLQKNYEINSAHQSVFGASWNDVWASICYLQLAQMASFKNDFLCTLLQQQHLLHYLKHHCYIIQYISL